MKFSPMVPIRVMYGNGWMDLGTVGLGRRKVEVVRFMSESLPRLISGVTTPTPDACCCN